MGKKSTNAAAKAAKKEKAALKVERKETKKVLKSKTGGASPAGAAGKGKGKSKSKKADDSDSDDDLEGILEKMKKEWEEAHTVTEELVEGPPSRRANATLTACPSGNHLWCIGGEFFSEDGKAYFYNDVFRYSPDKDEWRKFVSPTCPGPRSAHAVVASPVGGGKLFLFGGEFSSLHQNSFHHYRDFWCFDIPTHSWDRIDTKIRPTARSGHRMAVWKHYIILFGGFYDPGITTRYLNDLWFFDTQEYKWTLVEFKDTAPRPSPRSGFSFLPCAEGVVLHGGYCKEYMKGKRPVGVMLDDTWLLNISFPSEDSPSTAKPSGSSRTKASSSKSGGVTPIFKWEKRKRPSDAYAPCQRSGCTMALWPARNMGVLFGGVTDEDTSEERLDSVFWNDLYGYQLTGKGKWISMTLKKPKAKGGKRGAKKKQQHNKDKDEDEKWNLATRKGEGDDGEESDDQVADVKDKGKTVSVTGAEEGAVDVDDPLSTTPLPRYNAMLAVLRNTLYIYGGIYERGSREYTLDDFYALQLDKMEVYQCLKKSDVVIPEGEEESSSDEDEDDEDEDGDDSGEDTDDEDGETLVDEEEMRIVMEKDEDGNVVRLEKVVEDLAEDLEDVSLAEEETNAPDEDEQSDLRAKATAFMGVSKDTTRSAEDVQSTPLPGETLAMFYARSREYWTQKAVENSGNRGKQLRRDGFALAEERYAAYKPMLEEVEKILQEAGLDEEEMRRGAAGGPALPGSGTSRNRR
ncbi:galactose oxidase [Agrocybe pediades]|nr:galactose oxidase [Agrocybe pediades]